MEIQTLTSEKLLDRLIDFAVNCVMYAGSLPKSISNRIFCEQLVKSSSSSAANYSEAMVAFSKREWGQKVGISRKEMKESSVWLRILTRINAKNRQLGLKLLSEAEELCKIFTAMSKTSRKKSFS